MKPNQHLPFLSVDLISKPYSVHDGQLEVDVALLQLICLRVEMHLILIVAGLLVFKRGIEQRVH